IFEVKAKRVLRKGNVTSRWEQSKSELISSYEHGDFKRSLTTHVIHSGSAAGYSNGRISFLVDLASKASWHACLHHVMNEPAGSQRRSYKCVHVLRHPESLIETELRDWKNITTSITSSNEDIYRLFRQSVEDMAALRLDLGEKHKEFIPAAGVPWFVADLVPRRSLLRLPEIVVHPDF